MKVTHNGVDRFVHGRAVYVHAPELGTVVGPNDTGELMTVVGEDGPYALFSVATAPDITAAAARIVEVGPRSLTEAQHPMLRAAVTAAYQAQAAGGAAS